MKQPIIILFLLSCIICGTAAGKSFVPPSSASNNDTIYTHDTMSVSLPEFFDIKKLNTKDTTYVVKCYDAHDSLMTSWKSFDDVHFVSVFKNYTDYEHTYKDHGKQLPLPVSYIAYRYDKLGPHKWSSIEYATHKYTELKEEPETIVKTDMTQQRLLIQRFMPDGYEVRQFVVLYKYYKVRLILIEPPLRETKDAPTRR